jgi:hypothetical protein
MNRNSSAPSFIPPDFTIPRAIPQGPPFPADWSWDVGHKYSKHSQRLHEAVEAVSKRISVNPSSRIVRWVKAVDKLSNANKRSVLEEIIESLKAGSLDHPFRDAFTALMESRTFIEVVEQLLDYLSNDELRELVRGHPDPALDNSSARARNKEFEWYIAALFRRAGLPVAIAEPDILIEFNGSVRSIAAKRLSSRKQLKSNIKSAQEQIERAAYPGYIFLEVTKYINPDMHFVEHWRDEGKTVEPRLHALGHKPEVVNIQSSLVAAVFMRAAFPHISPGFEYGTSERWHAIGMQSDARDENMLLLHVLLSGVRGV